MSIHPSLGSTGGIKKQRSVLKRSERLKIMLEKDQWKEGQEIFGLPKIKTLKIKIKKEKAEKAEGAEAAAGGAAPAGAAAAAPAEKAQGAASKTAPKAAASKTQK
ncbi:MAG: small basic protein [Candidatus Omnitrophota bacterium]|jgi:small basic protein (TIGR04137 family)|nr:MAG: small basic protein [Candidatus Omnitrophota bacterium]